MSTSLKLICKKTICRVQKTTQKWAHYTTPIFGGKVPLLHCFVFALPACGRTTSAVQKNHRSQGGGDGR